MTGKVSLKQSAKVPNQKFQAEQSLPAPLGNASKLKNKSQAADR